MYTHEYKKLDIRNQTLNCKVPTRNKKVTIRKQTLFWLEPLQHKKMAESVGENPLSYTRIWVYTKFS